MRMYFCILMHTSKPTIFLCFKPFHYNYSLKKNFQKKYNKEQQSRGIALEVKRKHITSLIK